MARSFFRSDTDLVDRSGYYLVVGLIGFILLFFDHRTEVFQGIRSNLYQLTSTIFFVSGETRKRVRSQFLTIQEQQQLASRVEQLETINARLQARIINLGAVLRENAQLRDQLQLELRESTSLLVAQVNAIQYRPNLSQSIVIGRGSEDGIVAGLPVISHFGVIGQVTKVFDSASEVLLITDKSHALPVLLKNSRHRLIAEGSGADGFLDIHEIDARKKIQIGENVLTSGLGGIFPSGYPVGKVVDIEHDQVTGLQEIRVQPAVDITTIEYVLVVLEESPDGGER